MNSNDGMVMWLLGGTGVFLLYSAYKNQQPQALLATYVNGETATAPISTYGVTSPGANIANPNDGTDKTPGVGINTFPTLGTTYGTGGLKTRQDISGTWNLIDRAGRMIGVVPDNYQKTPNLYIPAVSV